MKHYRILEKKEDIKIYKIQYQQKLFLGLYFWKNYYLHTFSKYEDALSEIKNIIDKSDYETSTIGYHYIDAYKLFKTVKPTPPPSQIIKDGKDSKNKSVFIPK
jgi:hypothetical protein